MTQVSFANFASTTGLVSNGLGGPLTVGNKLEMLDGVTTGTQKSVWWHNAVPDSRFSTSFSFTLSAQAALADGITFTIQNSSDATAAIGAGGNGLGYTGIDKSVALGFDWYNFDAFGSTFGFISDGAAATSTVDNDVSPVDFHSGDTFDVVATYDGTNLAISLTDATVPSDTYTNTEAVNIPSTLGSTTGYVGFTAGAGTHTSQPQIINWTYSGNNPPTFASAAKISPSPVTNLSGALSVLGADDAGEGGLTYNWTLVKKPSGAKNPLFSANDSNTAKNTNARFYKAGHYDFRCTITDGDGLSISQLVEFNVAATVKRIHVEPHAVTIKTNATEDYSGRAYDQFDHLMSPQPTFTFSLLEGAGSINASTGVYTASDVVGHLQIKVKSGSASGTAGAVVVA